jgi:hypothetical protein
MFYLKELDFKKISDFYFNATFKEPKKYLLNYGKETYYKIKSLIIGE